MARARAKMRRARADLERWLGFFVTCETRGFVVFPCVPGFESFASDRTKRIALRQMLNIVADTVFFTL